MAATCCSSLGEDAEGEDGLQEGEQQQRGAAAVQRGAASRGSLDDHEAGHAAAADSVADPRLVLRHSGVDSRPVGQSAALAEAHHAAQHPLGAVFNHQGAAGVALDSTTTVS